MKDEQVMTMNEEQIKTTVQPESYTGVELSKLREFIEILKKDESRSALACWGNYSDYNHGY